MITTWCFWLFSRISKTCYCAGRVTATRIKVCNNSLTQNTLSSDTEAGQVCSLQEAGNMEGKFTQSLLSTLCYRACSSVRAPRTWLLTGANPATRQSGDRLKGWKVFGRSCTPTPCSRLGQLQSQSCVSQVLNISRKGDFTTSADNLFQCLTNLNLFSSLNILMEFPLLVICDNYPVYFQEEADSDSSLAMLSAAGSRALPPPPPPPALPTQLRMLPSPSPDATCPQTTLVTLLWALPIFSMPLSHGFMQQCPFQGLLYNSSRSNLSPINDLNSSLHLLSPATFPAMCC